MKNTTEKTWNKIMGETRMDSYLEKTKQNKIFFQYAQ